MHREAIDHMSHLVSDAVNRWRAEAGPAHSSTAHHNLSRFWHSKHTLNTP